VLASVQSCRLSPALGILPLYLFHNFILLEGPGCKELYTQGVCHMEAPGISICTRISLSNLAKMMM
jgi:hypothetical protein